MRSLLFYYSDKPGPNRHAFWAGEKCLGYIRIEVIENCDELEALDQATDQDDETFLNTVGVYDEVQAPEPVRPVREFGFGIKHPPGGDRSLQAAVLEHKPRKDVHGVGQSGVSPKPPAGGSGKTNVDV